MIEEDTIRLLQECDAGIKMGVQSIGEVLPYVNERQLKQLLEECRNRHDRLGKEVEKELRHLHEEGKEPGLMAQAMSWIKTNGKLSLEMSDRTIAGLMTDGANMGVKTLHRYLNQYQKASKDARDITLRLASMEEQLAQELQPYLQHRLLQLTGSEGGMDASHMVAQTGIPMPVFGPGNHRLLGTVDECVALDDFVNAIKIYALTVYYMLGI